MPPSKSRFVTACQQVLALGAVLAVLAPATEVISLDVMHQAPATTAPQVPGAEAAQRSRAGASAPSSIPAEAPAPSEPVLVPTEPVEPEVTEYALTPERETPAAPPAPRRTAPTQRAKAPVPSASPSPETEPTTVTSEPTKVDGFGAIGVTWASGSEVSEEAIAFRARTLEDGVWSPWTDMVYHDEHGPDPSTPEARRARPGTDELLVGDVEQVQVQAIAKGGTLPADMKLAVVEPGEAEHSRLEPAAIDTAELGASAGAAPAATESAQSTTQSTTQPTTESTTEPTTEPTTGTEGDALDLQAATYTPRPTIYSRAQWGANERLRDKGSLRYHEVHAGFVHHTVNANNYTAAEVPGIIRSIYAYHTQSRGWSDLGYNFLVDRFGRIWEGRAGGVDRPVVGAHTQGYNDYSFAMSAIGNFETAKPTSAMLRAYGALFAWKLSLHGVSAASTAQRVGSKSFRAINGHRDAGQTACPGRYLYAQIPTIRNLAAQAQRGWAGRELESNLAGGPESDVLARRASDGRLFIVPTAAHQASYQQSQVSTGWSGFGVLVASPDLTGDGKVDLLVRNRWGGARIRPGDGAGGFGRAVGATRAFADHDLITPIGDFNGDRRNDMVARRTADGRLMIFYGNGRAGFRPGTVLGRGWAGIRLLGGVGDLTGDRRGDLLARDSAGRMWLFASGSDGRFSRRVQLPGTWTGYRALTGFGDYTGDGRTDVVAQDRAGYGYVLAGAGNGTLGAPVGPISGFRAGTLAGGGNLSGSAAPDLLARSGDALVLAVSAGASAGPIDTGISARGANRLLNVGDWDRDGRGDVVIRSAGNLLLYRGNGTGRFAAPVVLSKSFGTVSLLAAVGDMTGDGYPDLMGQPRGGAMMIYPGFGVRGLRTAYAAYRALDGSLQIGVGRWTGDGAPDSLVRRGSAVVLYPGNGPGGLTAGRTIATNLGGYDQLVGVRDASGDGHADVVARERATGRLWLLAGTASGFGGRRLLREGMGGFDLLG